MKQTIKSAPSKPESTNPDFAMSQNEIISLIAHELKNPIASVRGYAELLSSGAAGEVNPTQQKFLNTMLSNIDRITEFLNDVNDSSRIDSGYQRVDLMPVYPLPIIEELAQQMKPQCLEKNLSLQLKIPADLPEVKADSLRLRQVLTNLIGNAVKYSLPGTNVTVYAKILKPKMVFTIQDQGIGIEAEQQAKIFQPYFRSDDAQSREIPGTGLGLYITKRLVELQGGTIWFESQYLKGSTFHFSLELA